MDYETRKLKQQVQHLELELIEERKRTAAATALLMSGEALRNKMMLNAILSGSFKGGHHA